MPSDLQVFSFQSQQVRTILKDGEPWFVAADVCRILSINNPSDALKRLDKDERTLDLIEGSHRPTNIISESGLYTLILRSDKPQAKSFRKWVTSIVLPSIRKTGKYQVEQEAKPAETEEHTIVIPKDRYIQLLEAENTLLRGKKRLPIEGVELTDLNMSGLRRVARQLGVATGTACLSLRKETLISIIKGGNCMTEPMRLKSM